MPHEDTIESLVDQLKTTTDPDQVELINRKLELLRDHSS